MEFLSQHVIPPDPGYLSLLQVLSVMVYLIHLPYAGVVIGSTILSMWLSFSHRELPHPLFDRFATDLVETFLGRKAALLVLGILPLLVLPILYIQWFVGLDATPLVYIPLGIVPIVLGFVMVGFYRASFPARKSNFSTHISFGLLGVLLLLAGYFVLLSAIGRLHDPEKWFRVTNIGIMLLNWNVIWKFLFFLHAAAATTGAAILFFFFRWSGGFVGDDPEYARLVRRFGGGITLAFTFALPVFYVFYIFTSPDVVFDNSVYVMATGVSFVALLVALFAFGSLGERGPRHGTAVFVLILVLFTLAGTVDHKAMVNANQEHVSLLTIEAEKEKAQREAEIEAVLAESHGEDLGEQTFTNVCVQCHKFDQKVVGPALASVLPKYEPNPAALEAFINNPYKVDQAYPPMPNLGLSSAQIKAVSEYVLAEYKSYTGDGAAQEQPDEQPAMEQPADSVDQELR